ncbi:314_t:CDS:2 [Acaulospora colombiana]|uniref:314_t:CDS:1 n=1 Tax=Acaulospora colombiana TaxID=27376 RepID=A0ACA9L5G3_9GLOM|nr:314_t:CDS:2 [Acaulospora colombiana]
MSPLSIFIVTIALAVGLVVSVDPAQQLNCSFSSASYSGPREKYIVFLDPTSAKSTTNHLMWLNSCLSKPTQKLSTTDFSATTIDKNKVIDFSVDGKVHGYTAWFDAKFVTEQLSKRKETLLVEKDAPVKISAAIPPSNDTTQKNPNPNLDRIDQAKFPLDEKYTFPTSAGSGTTVYVVDTGVLVSHKEFEGRATFGGAFCAGCPQTDDNGHGSHVSGIVAGKTFGVAKKANIIGVKVLAADGSGTSADVISGLMFVLTDHKKRKNSIVNMSLGGPLSAAMNKAVKSLTDDGVHVVVAAGNDAADACGSSPASEPSAITVGATEDTSDDITDFSDVSAAIPTSQYSRARAKPHLML